MGKKGGDQEVVSRTELDEKSQAYLDNYRRNAQNVANPAIEGRMPSMIPGVDPLTRAGQAAIGGMNQTSQNYKDMQGRYAGLGENLGLGSDILQRAGRGDVSAFYDPYQQQVIDASQADFARQRQIASMQAADEATKAGAFGGSRGAVLQANLNEGVNRDEASTLANLRSQGFQGAYDRALGVAGANANLGLSGMEGIGQGEAFQKNLDAQRARGLIDSGEYNRQLAERKAREQWELQKEGLGVAGSGLGMGSQTEYGPSQSSNPLLSGLGGAASGFAVGGPIGAGIGGGLGLLGGLFDW